MKHSILVLTFCLFSLSAICQAENKNYDKAMADSVTRQ